jgi:hypothetical protein
MLGNRVNPNGLCHECAGQAVAATQPAPQRQADQSKRRSYTKSVLRASRATRASQSALKLAQVIGAFGMRCPSDSERRTRFVGDPGRPTTRGKDEHPQKPSPACGPCRAVRRRACGITPVKAEGPVETDEVADIQAGGTLFDELDDEMEFERDVDAVDVGAARVGS